MLIAKRDKWKFVAKTWCYMRSVAAARSLGWLARYLKSSVSFWTRLVFNIDISFNCTGISCDKWFGMNCASYCIWHVYSPHYESWLLETEMKFWRKIISLKWTSKTSIKYGFPRKRNRTVTFKVKHRKGNDINLELRQIDVWSTVCITLTQDRA
jgi:hypothetical protein